MRRRRGIRTLVVRAALLASVVSLPSYAAEPSPAIGFQGFDDVRIGMSLWALLVALGEQLSIESVEGDCTSVYESAETPPELVYMIVDDALVRVEVRAPTVATVSGVTVGDTEADVIAAYPGRVEVSDHEYQEGHYLTVYSTDRRSALVFDTDGTSIRSFRIGRLPEALHVEGCS